MRGDWQKQLKVITQQTRLEQEREQAAAKVRQAQTVEKIDFATAVGSVTALKNSHRRLTPPDNAPIRVRSREEERDHANDIFVSTGEMENHPPSRYSEGGGGKNDILKLLSAQNDIVATLDLHGYTQEEAQVVLNEFIDYVQKRGTIGEIIHGSGLGSRGFVPTLKSLVRRWLIAHPAVLAYTEAGNNDGAVRILLKRKK